MGRLAIAAAHRGAMMTVAGVTFLGLVLSMGSALFLAAQNHASAVREDDRRTELVVQAVEAQTGRYLDTLRTVAASVGAITSLTSMKYQALTAPLLDMHLAGATSIAFLVPATDSQIPAVQSFWRTRGDTGLILHAVGTGREHMFTIFRTGLVPGKKVLPDGTDASQAAAPSAALDAARRSGQVTVSDTYHLITDQSLPVGQQQLSFVLTAAVYRPADPQGRRAFAGWVLMGLRGQDFMGATLQDISQNLLDVTLYAQNTNHTTVPVASLRASAAGRRDLHRAVDLQVANRWWQVRTQASADHLPGDNEFLPIGVAGAGSVLSALLGLLVYLLATGRARAEAAVVAATGDLREQKTLLEAIMDSVGDGIVVIDSRGEFILTNHAADPYLVVGEQLMTDSHWDRHVQLFHVDGLTPFPPADMPTARALAGESSHDVEMIRRAGPEEIVLSVSARPLDQRAGRKAAVGVFHDITARTRAQEALRQTTRQLSDELTRREATETELRLREAELAGFAGIAAHDLKAPLRAVSGFTRILKDTLTVTFPDGLDADLAHSMDRITTAVQRMSHLIDDLLAFATARDRALHPQPVDLSTMIGEIITETTAHLDSTNPSDELPTFDVQTLLAVYADPGMCRQLFDNLIGNALKFTQPGQPARIEISAHAKPDGWIGIDIADRGIGIPSGRHQEVFASFHRAHSGYTGSGLGLAICQRIVERHGGTIAATDNPGGGSRFHLTLPRAEPDTPGRNIVPTQRSDRQKERTE